MLVITARQGSGTNNSLWLDDVSTTMRPRLISGEVPEVITTTTTTTTTTTPAPTSTPKGQTTAEPGPEPEPVTSSATQTVLIIVVILLALALVILGIKYWQLRQSMSGIYDVASISASSTATASQYGGGGGRDGDGASYDNPLYGAAEKGDVDRYGSVDRRVE